MFDRARGTGKGMQAYIFRAWLMSRLSETDAASAARVANADARLSERLVSWRRKVVFSKLLACGSLRRRSGKFSARLVYFLPTVRSDALCAPVKLGRGVNLCRKDAQGE